jgi:SAM-dependent methyltransferase/tetratricopeptide (TPR) repeat protein
MTSGRAVVHAGCEPSPILDAVRELWGDACELTHQALLREARAALREEGTQRRPREALRLAGVALSRIGDHRRALPRLDRAVQEDPESAGRWNDLGMSQLGDGQPLAALRSFESARLLDPGEPWTLESLALAMIVLGRPEAAEEILRSCYARGGRPATGAALGTALLLSARLAEAEECFRQALAADPAHGDAHIGLGRLAERSGRSGAAAEHYRAALAGGNVTAKARFFLSQLHSAAKRFPLALEELLQALAHAPAHRPARHALVALLDEWRDAPATPELLRALHEACRSGDVDAHELLRPALRLIRQEPRVFRILEEIGARAPEAALGLGDAGPAGELFHQLLCSTLISDSAIEQQLAALRRRLLAELASTGGARVDVSLAAAMARQCFYNGFVYALGAEEESRVEALTRHLAAALGKDTVPAREHEPALLILAMYRPLGEGPLGEAIQRRPRSAWSPGFAEALRVHVWNRHEERAIARTLGCWRMPPAATESGTVANVRAQYESYPYPTWSSLNRTYPQPAATVLKSIFPGFVAPPFLARPCRVLVAGCGTGKHALATSRRIVTTELVAVDISLNSLAYGVRMGRELGLGGVTFVHGDLLRPPADEEQFDLIECAGVLHHLPDPEAGWRALCGLLRPGGVMKIALYSSRARQGIRAARRFLEQSGYTATVDGIRSARQALLALAPGELARGATVLSDFFSTSGCVDLLFHVQEQTFDLQRLGRCLDDLELRLLGFEAIRPEVRAAYQALFPSDPECTSLVFWHAFEELYPLTFLGMYQLWCQKPE